MSCGHPVPPYTPAEALTTFTIEEGFRIEVFASEPMILDPVAMEFDEHGRVFVVEMPGYPLNVGATGRVKLLEDTNQDGFPDQATVFADGLVLPTGVLRWKEGILVTDPPNVWYFEDTDGDNRADLRQAVLTGFALSNPQHTVSSPLYGLDNWIHLAHEPAIKTIVFKDRFGDPGSKKRFPNRNDGPQLDSSTGNLRFRPDTFELEALSGISQFGLSFDRWGHQFLVTSGRHIRQEVMAAAYLRRNPSLRAASPVADISDHTTRVYPITQNPEHRILTGPGSFTSACGISIYLGGLFPPPFSQVSFVAEPAHNLVHCDVLKEDGVTLQASRSGEETEFLASTDSWFRPVNLYTGPDGALYVVDYYRRIVEHPEWMSDEFHSQDTGPQILYEGSQQGRIYRITPASEEPVPLVRNFPLGKASDPDLVEYLNHPNLWWRMPRAATPRWPSERTRNRPSDGDRHRRSQARIAGACFVDTGRPGKTGRLSHPESPGRSGTRRPGERGPAGRVAIGDGSRAGGQVAGIDRGCSSQSALPTPLHAGVGGLARSPQCSPPIVDAGH